jgi:hypothetical protein
MSMDGWMDEHKPLPDTIFKRFLPDRLSGVLKEKLGPLFRKI